MSGWLLAAVFSMWAVAVSTLYAVWKLWPSHAAPAPQATPAKLDKKSDSKNISETAERIRAKTTTQTAASMDMLKSAMQAKPDIALALVKKWMTGEEGDKLKK